MGARTVKLELNRQQLELIDRTLPCCAVTNRVAIALIHLALREFAAKRDGGKP